MAQKTATTADAYLTGAARALSLTGAAVGLGLLFLLAVGVSLDTVITGGYAMFTAAIMLALVRVTLIAVNLMQ